MFLHLDDAETSAPVDDLWAGTLARARALRRRRRRLAAATTAVAMLVPAGAVAVAVRHLQPTRVHIDATPSSTSVDATSPSIESPPTSVAAGSAGTITVLVVGTDRGVVADEVSARGDTILLVRLDPAGSRRIVSLPRDLRVIDPRTNVPTRINALVGNRSVLVRVVGELLGVSIDHYVETDLPTFAAIGDAIGGVRLSFDHPVRDTHTGFEAQAGCATLDGGQLRAYARSRYLQWWDGATWQNDTTSDIGRMARLADVAQRVVRRSVDGSATDLDAVVTEILPRLTVDDRLSLAEARRLVGAARALRGTTVEWAVVPTSPVQEGQAQMLAPTDPAAAHDFLVAGRPLPLAEAAPWAATATGSADQPVRPNADACDR